MRARRRGEGCVGGVRGREADEAGREEKRRRRSKGGQTEQHCLRCFKNAGRNLLALPAVTASDRCTRRDLVGGTWATLWLWAAWRTRSSMGTGRRTLANACDALFVPPLIQSWLK